jgi:hypothetical protein
MPLVRLQIVKEGSLMHTLLSKLIGYSDKEILTSTWKTKKAPGISVGTASLLPGSWEQLHCDDHDLSILPNYFLSATG